MHYKLGTYSKLRALKNKHKTHMIIEGGHFEPFQCIYNLHESFDEVQLINSLSRAQVKNMRQFFFLNLWQVQSDKLFRQGALTWEECLQCFG